jgi:hypothetical protein
MSFSEPPAQGQGDAELDNLESQFAIDTGVDKVGSKQA